MSSTDNARTALVTGAAGPIGRAAVELFLERGWRVLAVDTAPPEPAPPAGAQFFAADLSMAGELDALCDQLQPELVDGLDALVNCPPQPEAKALLDTSLEDWDAMQALSLRAPALLSKNLYPTLKAAAGAVVNVAGAHRTSRGGLQALTRAMALDFGPDQVRANLVLAGPEMPAKAVARAIYFLADAEQSAAITGQSLAVDGGASAKLAIE